ncbi:bestrophin family protein [Desertivirga brevis]|uniref:bestrophin family protein n=1 Tax=Desertivirga brevis TaxID=2810310 RepID=UPI001A975E17|nr:bestrophin family ion channel [Pedobacter sp. SYSU D00873]
MLVYRKLKWPIIFHYTWPSLFYYFFLSLSVYLVNNYFNLTSLHIPFNIIAALSTALAIFLGFKNNNAYDRWWEARQIWGLLVNYSRAWAREVMLLISSSNEAEQEEIKQLHKKIIYRHIAFVHGLRVFLRRQHYYNKSGLQEYYEGPNEYSDVRDFISPLEYEEFTHKNNPPNYLIEQQGRDLKNAYDKGWISEFFFVRLEETLIEFNNIQGRCERIKNTPLPRQYSSFSKVFVLIHASLLPFVFIQDLGWLSIPFSVIISFVFRCLDLMGERAEDPFENRIEDVPLTALSITIETNLKEQLGEKEFPKPKDYYRGIVL